MLAGIETGGTKVVCGVVDESAPTELVMTRRFPTTTPSETIARIVEFVQDADRELGVDAVGIASFGPVNVDPARPRYGWITGTSKPGWANTKLLERLAAHVSQPLALVSDVSGAALGEQRWGAGRDVGSLAYATFGTGVGIGVVIDGRVLHSNGAPEVGHLLVRRHPADDFPGSCPFHGDCLEGLAAGPSVLARWGADSSHLPSRVEREAFEILGYYVAQAVAAISYSTGVERVAVGGGVVKAPGLLDEARRQLTVVTGGPLAGHPIAADPWDFMVPPELGDRSGVLGAVAAAQLLAAPHRAGLMDAAEALLAHPALRAFVESVVPADEHPSAWEVGAPEFLRAMLTGERRDLAEPALAALEAGSDDEALAQLADLVIQGYYGDPGNGGNRGGASWSMIGYRPRPEGAQWPRLTESAAPVTAWSDVRPHYDAVVVGAGAGGGVAACVLAEAGLRVLLVERGSWLAASALPVDHLRSQRLSLGYETRVDPPSAGHPRVVPTPGGAATTLLATDPRWGNNALTVGGGTRVYGAQAWRFCPEDFAMASTYGVPEGSSLADWPLAYDDLEADYDRAEWELGVSGDAAGDATAGPRRRGYPMPPFPHALDSARLAAGAAALGLGSTDVPLLINTTPYNGRGACIRCASCVGFACPGEFKTDTRNTVIPRAVATGRCDVLTGAQVARVLTDADGRVAGVRIVGERTLEVSVDDVVLAAGAVETARLLLNSASASEPAGLGNRHDQIGRHLQSHVYAGAWGLFDEPVRDSVGPGPGIATTDHRHANPGIIGGAMLANDFVPTPLSLYYSAVGLGLVPRHGAESKRAMRELFPRLLVVMGPVQEVPSPESRVTVDPSVLDRWGLPAARLSGGVHPEDLRTADFAADRAVDWLRASGAASTYRLRHLPDAGPSRGQHQAGTCRMGLDPATSVTDRWGRVWGHDNLTIADASLHVTNGGVNPVLTVLALAYRVAGRLAEERGGVR